MSIQELSLKFKGLSQNTEVLLAVLIVIVSLASFFLGRLSVGGEVVEIQAKNDITHTENAEAQVIQAATKEVMKSTEVSEKQLGASEKGSYVASKSGTKYHLPRCGSAKQIKEENKIWFATKEEAEKAGYTPAANCKGI